MFQLAKVLQQLFLSLDVTMGRRCGLLTPHHVEGFTTKLRSLPVKSKTIEDPVAALPVYAPGAEFIGDAPVPKARPVKPAAPTETTDDVAASSTPVLDEAAVESGDVEGQGDEEGVEYEEGEEGEEDEEYEEDAEVVADDVNTAGDSEVASP